MRLSPDLSPVGWFLFGAIVLLIFSYLYFWWMVIKASSHKHASRENVTNRKHTASLAHAKRKGNSHRFLIQITTKGGALSVVQRGVDRVYASVDLLEKPRELYESLPDSARRNLLGAFFKKLNVLITEDGLHLTSERTEINEAFHEWQTHHRLTSAAHTPTKTKRASRIPAEDPASVPYRLTQSKGLNKPVLVGLTGFEPATP